jgi:hypothetical protein
LNELLPGLPLPAAHEQFPAELCHTSVDLPGTITPC